MTVHHSVFDDAFPGTLPASVVAAVVDLDAIEIAPGEIPDDAEGKAEDILRRFAPPAVVEAHDRLRARIEAWWAA